MKNDSGTVDRLLTTQEAADLLRVHRRTVLGWIRNDAIPYVALPKTGRRRDYRIPLHGLLAAISGTYDLAARVRRMDEVAAARSEHEAARGDQAQARAGQAAEAEAAEAVTPPESAGEASQADTDKALEHAQAALAARGAQAEAAQAAQAVHRHG